jgi:RNA polymerase sigma factor (sigma-70 family)
MNQNPFAVDIEGEPEPICDPAFGSAPSVTSGKIDRGNAMYYKRSTSPEVHRAESAAAELTADQMNEVRRAFIGLLHRRRYSPSFITNNADDLLQIAHTEYVRAVEKGVDVHDPVAWTINCAWRRLQNHLTAEGRRPRTVSTDKIIDLPDRETPDPAVAAEEEDRAERVRLAVAELDEAERQLIALTYFEDMTLADAGRFLRWHPSKAKHTHQRALKHLFAKLGPTGEDVRIEIGLAAYLSLRFAKSLIALPPGVEAAVDKTTHHAQGFWSRINDAARRFSFGGGNDAATAIASSGAGRAAGACAAGVAVVCLGAAGGVVGPGLGINLSGNHDSKPSRSSPRREPKTPADGASRRANSERSIEGAAEPQRRSSVNPPASGEARRKSTRTAKQKRVQPSLANARTEKTPVAKGSEAKVEAAQVEEQTSGIARAAGESTSGETPAPAASASTDSTNSAPTVTVVHAQAPKSSPSEQAQAKEEFDGFAGGG